MRVTYNHPDLGDDPQPDPWAQADIALAKEIGAWLKREYPTQYRLFNASVDHRQGVVALRMPLLTGGTNCYILHIPMLQQGPTVFAMEMREAAGQLLERYRLPRGKRFDADLALDKISSISRVGLDQRAVPE